MAEWRTIESAPKDGSPVWARGWDWGKPGTTRHVGWVYWNGDQWAWSSGSSEPSFATHLTDWMPSDSRSRLRRVAHEKGEPVPRFDGENDGY